MQSLAAGREGIAPKEWNQTETPYTRPLADLNRLTLEGKKTAEGLVDQFSGWRILIPRRLLRSQRDQP